LTQGDVYGDAAAEKSTTKDALVTPRATGEFWTYCTFGKDSPCFCDSKSASQLTRILDGEAVASQAVSGVTPSVAQSLFATRYSGEPA
jgi:hypothetical protein